MRSLIAAVNKSWRVAQLMRFASQEKYNHFFDVYQQRMLNNPDNINQYIQDMISQPIIVQYIDDNIKRQLGKNNPKYHDIQNEAVSLALQNLQRNLSNYNPQISSLQSYINKSLKWAIASVYQEIQKDNNINGQSINSLNKLDLSNYNQETNHYTDNILDSLEDNTPSPDAQNELQQSLLHKQSILQYALQNANNSNVNIEAIRGLKSEIADLQHKLGLPFNEEDNNFELGNVNLKDTYRSDQNENIPASELSSHLYDMMRFPQTHKKHNPHLKNHPGNLPAQVFFNRPGISKNPEIQKLLSQLMFESAIEVRKQQTQEKHNNPDLRATKQVYMTDLNSVMMETMARKMAEYNIPEDIQENIMQYIESRDPRELGYRMNEADELSRFSMYSWLKNKIAPNKEWSELTEADIQQIAESVYSRMGYENNNSMSVRSIDPNRKKDPMDVSPRSIKQMPKETAIQVILNEINNLKEQKKGSNLFATLPADNPVFYESKRKQNPPDNYSGNIVNEAPDVYHSLGNEALQETLASCTGLLRYAEWCDKQNMYDEADRVHSYLQLLN